MSPDIALDALTDSLARIRGLLEHPVRTEDPECCLFMISEIVIAMIGDRAGIPPADDEEDA